MTDSSHTGPPDRERVRRPPPPNLRPAPHPEFTRRLLLIMALFALGLKLVSVALGAMLVPEAAIRLITLLALLSGLGYLLAYYFRRGPFRADGGGS